MAEFPRVFTSRRSRQRTLLYLGLLVGALALGSVLLGRFAPSLTDPVALRTFVLAFGPAAPAAFVVLQALQVVVAPVPGQVLGFVGGYLFGAVFGWALSLLGATVGTAVAVWLSRRYGRQYVERVIAPDVLAQFDDFTAENGLFAVFLVFLIPGLPDDVVCFVAGLTELPLRRVVLVSVVGRAPGYFVVALAGAEFASLDYVTMVLLLGLLAALSTVGYVARGRLLAVIDRRLGG